MATMIEIQPVVCDMDVLDGNSGSTISDVFVVMPRDLPTKPVVFLDSGVVRYGPDYSFAELVRKN